MRAAVVCMVLGLASLAVAEADGSHVKMSANQAEIDDESAAPVRLPLQLDDGWRLVKVEVIDAAINGRRDKDVLEAFSKVASVGGVAVELFIQRDALKWPGTYQVILQLTVEEVVKPAPGAGSAASPGSGSAAKPGAAAPAPAPPPARVEDRETITITKAGPRLETPPAVTIQVTSAFLHDFLTVTPVLLDETSNRGRLTRVTITQRGVTTHDSAPTDTRVVVKMDPDTVDPGGQRALVAEVVGDAPWGTSAGNLEVNALQLDKPVTVPFTIEHRRWTGYILIVFALGGLVGFVIRTWSKRVTDRLQLQQDGSDARAALLELDKRSLPAEHKQLAAAEAAIKDAVTREDDAALKKAIDAATALATASAATHTTQLADQRALLVRYAAVPALLLTGQIGVETSGYPEALRAIEDALLEHDVRRADRELGQLEARLAGRRDALKAWAERLADALDAMATAIATAPTTLKTRWSTVTSEPIRVAAKKKLMLEACEAAEPAVGELDGHVYQSRHELARLAGQAKTRLSNAPQLAAELAQAVTARDGDLPSCVAQLAATLAAWSAILQRALAPMQSSSNPAIAAAAETALTARNAGDYETAFDKLNTLMQKPQGGDAIDVPTVPAPTPPAPPADPVPIVLAVPAVLDGALVSPALRRTGSWITALQVLAAYCILPFGAWLAYHESFIGRLPELIAIAATGFITDFTADAAVAKIEGLKK